VDMGSSGSRSEWVLAAVVALPLIAIANLWPVASLIVAWLLGTVAIVALIRMRARRLGRPPSISLVFQRPRVAPRDRRTSH
jgi:hypothetical protein